MHIARGTCTKLPHDHASVMLLRKCLISLINALPEKHANQRSLSIRLTVRTDLTSCPQGFPQLLWVSFFNCCGYI
jgi:hypothetical protein